MYNLPVALRRWFLQRTVEEFKKQKEAQDKAVQK
jgi:hypothetical protein